MAEGSELRAEGSELRAEGSELEAGACTAAGDHHLAFARISQPFLQEDFPRLSESRMPSAGGLSLWPQSVGTSPIYREIWTIG